MRTFLAVMVMASAGVARAQPGVTLPRSDAPDPTTDPGFAVIDQTNVSSGGGLEMSYIGLDSSLGEDAPTLLRFAANARYVDAARGVGGYVRLPFAYARSSSGGMSDTVTDLGNIEIGGIYSPRFNQRGTGVILRAGITLPTGESGEAATVGTIASFAAFPDLYNALPRATTLKLGLSPVFRAGAVFARLDFGLDWNLDANRAALGKVLHFDAGVGADLGPFAVMLESANATVFSEQMNGSASTADVLGISARYTSGQVSPYLAVVIPLDEDLTGFLSVAVTAGAQFRL
jgi:hypothetical protein